MNKYITYRDEDKNGNLQYYILQREHPHYVGLISAIPIADSLMQIPIAGYNLWVTFAGVLRGNYLPIYNDVKEELSGVYQEMALWYLDNRILIDEKKYKKFKIISK